LHKFGKEAWGFLAGGFVAHLRFVECTAIGAKTSKPDVLGNITSLAGYIFLCCFLRGVVHKVISDSGCSGSFVLKPDASSTVLRTWHSRALWISQTVVISMTSA